MTRRNQVSVLAASATLLAALCPAGGALRAQDGGRVGSFGASLRFDHFAATDRLTSPRRHGGEGLSQNGFFVSLRSDDSVHEVEGWLGSMGVEADGGFSFRRFGGLEATPESEVELVEGAYRYLRRVRGGPWWLGVAMSLQVNHTTYEFGAGVAEGFLYYGALELNGRREVDLGEGRGLVLAMEIPLIAWATRPTWSTVDEERLQSSSDFFHRMSKGGLTWPGELQAVSGRVLYEHPLASRLAFRSGAKAGYVRHTGGPAYRAFRLGIEAGLTIRWTGDDR